MKVNLLVLAASVAVGLFLNADVRKINANAVAWAAPAK